MGKKSQRKRGQILEERREEIWQELQPFLGPMKFPKELFPKIRPYQGGAHEILRVVSIHKNFLPFYLEVTFMCAWAYTGEQRLWHVRFNTGMLVVPMIGDKILLKREFRLPVGKMTRELPRCFANLHQEEGISKDRSLAIIKAILRTEDIGDFFLDKPLVETVLLHEGVYENTGTDANSLPVYLVKIKGQENPERSKKGKLITWSLHDLADVAGILRDTHSMAALFLLKEYLQGL